MKTFDSTNFFKHTFCEFHEVNNFKFPQNSNYKSNSNSYYFYTDEGVYRKSNHWGRVANCRWKLIANNDYKNQKEVIGFAKWTDFYPIHSSIKNFFIEVNFKRKLVKICASSTETNQFLFTFLEAKKRVKKIRSLLKNDNWACYYNQNKDVIIQSVITEFITSNKNLIEIKKKLPF